MLITKKLLTVWSVWQMNRSPLGFQLKTQPRKNCGMCTAPYGYCNFWMPERRSCALWHNCTPVRRDIYHVMTHSARVVFKDPDLGQEKQALAFLILLRSRFLKYFFLRVFINYLEGRIKWSRGPYTARGPEVPHPWSKVTDRESALLKQGWNHRGWNRGVYALYILSMGLWHATHHDLFGISSQILQRHVLYLRPIIYWWKTVYSGTFKMSCFNHH